MSTEIEWTPRAPGPLFSLADVRTELGKVYRDTRLRRIPGAEGTKLVYILAIIAKTIESSEFEQRLQALEVNPQSNRSVIIYEEPESTTT